MSCLEVVDFEVPIASTSGKTCHLSMVQGHCNYDGFPRTVLLCSKQVVLPRSMADIPVSTERNLDAT